MERLYKNIGQKFILTAGPSVSLLETTKTLMQLKMAGIEIGINT